MFQILVVSFAAIILLLPFCWYIYIYTYSEHLRNIPGPFPKPLLGNSLQFTDNTKIFQNLGSLFEKHGKIVKVWMGIEPIVFIADYKSVEAVLSSSSLLKKSKFYKVLNSWLGTGLLTSSGEKWRKRRKLLTPTYHFKILEQFVPTFDKIGRNLIGELKKLDNKIGIDIYPHITLATLDIICETAMGVSIDALGNKDSDYVQSVHGMSRVTMERAFSAVQYFDFLYQFTENCRREKEHLKILHGHTLSVIQKRRQELKNDPLDPQQDEFGCRRKIAFLDMLLQTTDDGVPLSDEDIREEVDTFMLEGHDTTSTGISLALYLIVQYPDVQEKLYREQQEIFGEGDRILSYQDLSNMKYLEMVIKETIRLYPPVPIYAREILEDIQIDENLVLSKGCTVCVVAYQIHRDPDYFKEPEKFNPDRFLPENQLDKLPYSYVPFSAGPRNCIGQKFAMLELKSALSKIIRSFEIMPVVPVHKLVLAPEAILKALNGVKISLKER